MVKIREGFFVVLALAVLLTGCGSDPQANPKATPQTHALATVTLNLEQVPLIYTTTGSIVSDERVDINSRIPAYVRTIAVREGERVAKNQLLATLDSRDIEANIRSAEARRDQAVAAVRDAEKDFADAENLFGKGVIPATAHRKSGLQLQLARDELAGAEAALAGTQAQRQYTRILSPVAGMVVARHQRSGDLASPGTPLITVESDTALLYETYIAEQRVGDIHNGDVVELRIDALGQTLAGEVVRLVSSGNPVTRGFQVKISLPPSPGLLPGMFGRSRFVIGHKPAVVIPRPALVERGGLDGVYVVGDDRQLRFRWVRREQAVGDSIVILAGLDAGETIVAAPTVAVRDGDLLAAGQ
ncbi:MAG: efflux RND transporter periplasmic adaptor subunit [Porticoccaceae bacterium]